MYSDADFPLWVALTVHRLNLKTPTRSRKLLYPSCEFLRLSAKTCDADFRCFAKNSRPNEKLLLLAAKISFETV
jgi:hypothetical protein